MPAHSFHLCGYPISREGKKRLRHKSLVRKWKAHWIIIFALFVSLAVVGGFHPEDAALIALPQEPTQPEAVKKIEDEPFIKKPKNFVSIVYVKGHIVNLRQHPSLESPIIWKLGKGQRLNQVSRSGDWVQVVLNEARVKRGWVHASLVEKVKLHATKKPFQPDAFKSFLTSFDRFNGEIKRLKGITFFKEVVYLGKGVVQVTATDILLSAPKNYKTKYLKKIMHMWLDVNKPSVPAVVRIVDKKGHLRLEEVRK